MRRLFVTSIAIVACVLSGTASSVPLCQDGQEAELSGTIKIVYPPDGVKKEWSFPLQVTGGDCYPIDLMVTLSNGAPPASCVAGSRVEVFGVVEPDPEYGENMRDPEELRCYPGPAAR